MAKTQKGKECLNCHSALRGENFCPNCGQKNDTRRLSLGEFLLESLSNFFAFDGRFFNTFIGVLLRPGVVAREFISGKRTRYMNPVRFYFLSSLALIASLQLGAPRQEGVFELKREGEAPARVQSPEEISADLAQLRKVAQEKNQNLFDRLSSIREYLELSPESSEGEVLANLAYPPNFWNRFAYEQARKINSYATGRGEFQDFNKAILARLFWILFLFLPILGLLLKLFFWKNDLYYPEHLFFAFFQQSLFFQGLTVNYLLAPDQLAPWLLLFALHLLLALRHFYQRRWRSILWRYLMLNFFGIISFVLFFIVAALVVFVLI